VRLSVERSRSKVKEVHGCGWWVVPCMCVVLCGLCDDVVPDFACLSRVTRVED
jgi:hypothetical protein